MKRSYKIAVIALLSFGLIGGGVFAYGMHKFGDPATRVAFVTERVSDKLDLNQTQILALENLKDEILQRKESIQNSKGELRNQVKNLIVAESFDQQKAQELIDNQVSMVNEEAPTMLSALGEFLDTLNPEQKNKIASFIDHKYDRYED
jgi:Spy/CpxP family protein refolding chaperone